jgi:hypothetical protein
MKKCPKCNTEKYIDQFSVDLSRKGGRQCYCRSCQSSIYEAKKEVAKEQRRKRYLLTKDQSKEQMRSYYSDHKDEYLARNALRRAAKLSATPSWLSEEDKEKIAGYYFTAQQKTKNLNEVFHVDHIVPLQGKNVCGLHVPWNLQIIPAAANLSKSNQWIE